MKHPVRGSFVDVKALLRGEREVRLAQSRRATATHITEKHLGTLNPTGIRVHQSWTVEDWKTIF